MTIKLIRCIAFSALTLSLASCASTPETVDPNAEFDLSEYLFHKKVNIENGVVNYTEKFFKKDEPPSVAAQYGYQYQRNGNNINVQAVGLEGLANQYNVTEDTINDVRPQMGDSRSFSRFARLGDTYLDTEFTSVNVSESCVLSDFFDTFHLSSATGSLRLSNKTYNNVIRVRCISEFTNRSTNRGNYRWSVYYAKGIGPIFKDGNWQNHLGQIYSIYEY